MSLDEQIKYLEYLKTFDHLLYDNEYHNKLLALLFK